MISLKDYLSMDSPPLNKALKVKVLRCSTIEKYKNAAGMERSMFTATVADDSGHTTIKCYSENHLPKFNAGSGVMIMNGINHKTHIAVTVKTVVALAAAPAVPEDIVSAALRPKAAAITSIEDALLTPTTLLTTVKGKLTRTSPAKLKEWSGRSCNLQVRQATYFQW